MKTGFLLSMALAAALVVPGVARADWVGGFGWSSGPVQGWGGPPPAWGGPPPGYGGYGGYGYQQRPGWGPRPAREVCETTWRRDVFWRNGVRITRDVPVENCRWVHGRRGW